MTITEKKDLDNLKAYLRQINLILYEYSPTHFNSFGQPLPYTKYGVYTRSKWAKDVKLVCYGNSVNEIYNKVNSRYTQRKI